MVNVCKRVVIVMVHAALVPSLVDLLHQIDCHIALVQPTVLDLLVSLIVKCHACWLHAGSLNLRAWQDDSLDWGVN